MTSRSLLNLGLAMLAIALVLVVIYRPGIEPDPVPQRMTSALDPAAATSIRVAIRTKNLFIVVSP